ncbi:MAG: site-specific DNA-methyltransferase [Deltaproteobacteria bacterium]|nr:site-specific DNA-methyltransferase [Deltaproteobacteria bacterium]MBW2674356.1 site-specific DNA-methyltransferase [Deltaproteobacteria bacterium]
MEKAYLPEYGWVEVWDLPKVPPKKQREGRYVSESFVHPAKMDCLLCRKIIETYTRPGDLVLDPMAGIGTTLVEAAYLGRNAVGVELEEKFVRITERNIGLMEGARTLTPKGKAQIIRGDARELSKLLAEEVDAAVFSPPYTGAVQHGGGLVMQGKFQVGESTRATYGPSKSNIGNLEYGKVDTIVTSPPYSESMSKRRKGYTTLPQLSRTRHMGADSSDENIGNLPHGEVDAIVTSPPYERAVSRKLGGGDKNPPFKIGCRFRDNFPAVSDDNIGNLPHGWIDAVITSPPYEEGMSEKRHATPGTGRTERLWREKRLGGYPSSGGQIGAMRQETYLSAMFRVYQECFRVLRPGGRMVLVVKRFIRNKRVVKLDLDTKLLCERAGFVHEATKLFRLPSRSFWRILYRKKFGNEVPEIDTLDYEFVLIFRKPS